MMFQVSQSVLSPSWEWIYGLVGAICVYTISLLLYNAFLHPLSKFPGPRLWATTTIPYGMHYLKGDLPFQISAIHEKYGSVVRITPCRLSYTDADAWNDIYGKVPGKAQLLKEIRRPPEPGSGAQGLFSTPSEMSHARMRRNFSPAFSDKAIREQEPTLNYYFDLLINRLYQNCRKPIDIVQWYNYTTFDIIGDLLFGESYECLEKSRLHIWIAFLFDQLWAIGVIQVMKGFPLLGKLSARLLSSSNREKGVEHHDRISARVDRRLESESSRLDLMTYVQKHFDTPEGMSIEEIRLTVSVFVIAGSETSATLLSGATYLLLTNPPAYQRLVNEIRTTFKSDDEITISNIKGLKYELAILEEALRIFPPVPVSLSRIIPPEGRMIAGKFVPGNTIVGVSQWGSYHSPSNFSRPHEFIPERWLGDAKYKDDNRKVVQPFSVGPRNCIGQNLAYAEMGVILAKVLWNFDLKLCEESRGWMENLKVYTLWKKNPLMVKLTPVVRA